MQKYAKNIQKYAKICKNMQKYAKICTFFLGNIGLRRPIATMDIDY